MSQECTKSACGMTVAPITPTARSIAFALPSEGTNEWYKMEDGSGFVINISYK